MTPSNSFSRSFSASTRRPTFDHIRIQSWALNIVSCISIHLCETRAIGRPIQPSAQFFIQPQQGHRATCHLQRGTVFTHIGAMNPNLCVGEEHGHTPEHDVQLSEGRRTEAVHEYGDLISSFEQSIFQNPGYEDIGDFVGRHQFLASYAWLSVNSKPNFNLIFAQWKDRSSACRNGA